VALAVDRTAAGDGLDQQQPVFGLLSNVVEKEKPYVSSINPLGDGIFHLWAIAALSPLTVII
jgi:hypothetical protein